MMSKFFYIYALFVFFSCQNSPTSSTSDCGLFYGEGSISDCLDSSDEGGSGNIDVEDCLGILYTRCHCTCSYLSKQKTN